MTRTRFIFPLILITWLALVGWLLYQHILIWTTPDPLWMLSGNQQSSTGCDAAPLDYFDAVPADPLQPDIIDVAQAHLLAERVLTGQLNLRGYLFFGGPLLLEITLPDGEQHLSWAYLAVLDDGGLTLLGEAAIVYLDARSGEPLALVSEVVIGDVQMVCSFTGLQFVPIARLWATVILCTVAIMVILGMTFALRIHHYRQQM